MNDLNGFTVKANKIITIYSQREAKRLYSDLVYPEHMFLSILLDYESAAVQALLNLGINVEELEKEVEGILRNKSRNNLILGTIPYSNRFWKVVDHSREEAKMLGHNYVGVEHLLLSIVNENDPESFIGTLLEYRDVTINRLRESVVNAVGYGEIGGTKLNKKKNTKTPFLDKFSRNITNLAKQGLLDPVIGRTKEIGRIVQILSRRQKNNPILIGDPGVGKTAIVEGIAQLIANFKVNEKLIDKRILQLDLGLIVAGTKYRGEFEERIKNILKEIEENDDIIVFIDEIHTILGAGNAEGALDASNMFKPALARGIMRCIGATTIDEYRKRIEKDKALVRRFQPVIIQEPSIEETIEILSKIKFKYEEFHNVIYTDDAVISAVKLSHRYLTDRKLPDKAIDLLDEAGAASNFSSFSDQLKQKDIENQLKEYEEMKNNYLRFDAYDKAIYFRDKIKEIKSNYGNILDDNSNNEEKNKKIEKRIITDLDIKKVLSIMTNIPISQIDDISNRNKYQNMKEFLKTYVKGQDKAIDVVVNAVKKNIVGLRAHKKPIGNFIFIGPTGVGKTALAKALAKFIFGSEDDLIRVDMSEYMEKFNVSRILGAPPGYVGYESGGELTEKVRRKPYSIILFDEIEKAHPDVFNLLLQILDEGKVTDSLGNIVDFRNTIIIMTSNIGTEKIYQNVSMGFLNESYGKNSQNQILMNELKNYFRPEFLNRIDEIVIFEPLTENILNDIIDKMINELNESLSVNKMKVVLTKEVKDFIVKNGFEQKFGARSIQRAIGKYIEEPLADKLLKENILDKNCEITILCELKDNTIEFNFDYVDNKNLLDSKQNNKKRKKSVTNYCEE